MSAGFRAGQANDGYLQINGTDILTVSSGVLGVKNTGAQSEMRLYCESNNAHYASLKSPPHSDFIGNVTFTLPGTSGSSGQVLQTDGSGNLSWVNNSGGGGGGVSDKMSEGNTEAEVVDTGTDGHFKVTTEGVERLRVDSDGKVGIDDTSPENTLSIKNIGSFDGDANSFYLGSNFTGTGQNFSGSGKHAQRFFFNNASSNGYLKYENTGTTGNAGDTITWQERFRITSAGKFGIGTNNPQEQLVVSNGGAEGFEVTAGVAANINKIVNYNRSSSVYSSLRIDAAEHIFRIGASEKLRVGSSGQIGIGGANYGTSGQVLTSGGASGAVSWTTISGGGGGSYGNSDVDNHLNSGAASSGQILSWNGSDYAWVADQGGSGGGGISDVADDTTPQLGGNLDLNSNNITGTGDIDITGDLDITGDVEIDTLTASGICTFNNFLRLPGGTSANNQIQLGNSQEFTFQYNTSSTKGIIQATGNDIDIRATTIRLQPNGGENGINVNLNGSVELYHDNAKKLETTSTGIEVTGLTDTDTLNVSGVSTFSGTVDFNGAVDVNSHVEFKGGSGNSQLYMYDENAINLGSNNDARLIYNNIGNIVKFERNGSAGEIEIDAAPITLKHTSNTKLQTTSTGVTVTGTLAATAVTGDGSGLTNLPSDTPADTDVQVTYDLSANGSSAYRFTGPGYSGADDNPDLYLIRGQRYRFINATGGHPFRIQSNTSGTAYTDGVSGSQTGTQDFNVQYNAPERLYYQCTSHAAMIGNIYIVGASDWRMTDVATSATPEIYTNLNVGIGTDNPAYQLSIHGTGAVRNEIVCTNNNDAGAGIYLRTMNGGSTVSNATLNTNTSGDLLIWTGTSGASERLRITAAGDINIGTVGRFDASGLVKSAHGSESSPSHSFLNDPDNGMYRPTTNTLGLVTAGSERLRIDSSGRILKGPTTARGNFANNASGAELDFQIEGTNFPTSSLSLVRNSNDANDCSLVIGKTRATSIGGNTVVQAGDDLGDITFAGADGTSLQHGANIVAEVQSGVGNDDMPTDLIFKTNGGTTSTTERLRITSDGNLDVTGGGNIIINEASKLYFEGDADDDLNAIWKSDATENTLFLTSRYNIANIIDSNNDDAASFWSVRHNATTLAGSGELMRVQSDGKVGINLTPSGSSKLQVNGSMRFAGSGAASDSTNPVIYRSSGYDHLNFATSGSERLRIDSAGIIKTPNLNANNHREIHRQITGFAGSSGVVNYILVCETSRINVRLAGRLFTARATGTSACASQLFDITFQTNHNASHRSGAIMGLHSGSNTYGHAEAEFVSLTYNSTNYYAIRFKGSNNGGWISDFDTCSFDGIREHVGTELFTQINTATHSISNISVLTDAANKGDVTIQQADLRISDGDIIMASGHGISFTPSSNASGMSSEVLDDYEEGTWSPAFGGTSSAPTCTYSPTPTGTYTKIGRLVNVSCKIQCTGRSGGGGLWLITGLPFTIDDTTGSGGSPSMNNMNVTDGAVNIASELKVNSTSFYAGLVTRDNASWSNLSISAVPNGNCNYRVQFSYYTDS